MFDEAKPEFTNLENVLDQLRAYLARLVRLSDSARIGDLFGLEAQNWAKLGREAGRNDRSKPNTIDSIRGFFKAGYRDACYVLERAARSTNKWNTTTDARRKTELENLQADIDRLRANIDPAQPHSLAAREQRRLDEYRFQLELTSELVRLSTDADQRAAADARLATERLQAHEALERSRIAWNASLYDQYQTRATKTVVRLNELKAEVASLDPEDDTYKSDRSEREHEMTELTVALQQSPELHAIEGAKLLLAATRLAEPAVPHESRPPKWWRFRLPKYRPLLWVSLIVAIAGEQIVMQQLTGRYLGLDMVPNILGRKMPENLVSLSSAANAGEIFAALSRLGGDGVNLVLALLFGSIPLLLSFPVRYYLDEKDREGKPPAAVIKASMAAIGALLLSLAAVAIIEGTSLSPFSGFAKGIALPSFTLVLILGAAWVMHLLFTEGSRHNYHNYLRNEELGRHQARIKECEDRIREAHEDVRAAEGLLLAATHRHAAEDSFAAGVGDGDSLPAAVFTAAEDAAVRAFESGYDAGVRARQLGIDLKEGETDQRPFDELMRHLTNVSMLDITGDEHDEKSEGGQS